MMMMAMTRQCEMTLDLNPIDDMDVDSDKPTGGGWKRLDVTVDSGAAGSVMDGEGYPRIPRTESEGSKKGQVYLGPGAERIPNKGEKKFKVVPIGGHKKMNMTFQDAKVRKPLAAVSGITAKDNIVLFDSQGSFIAPCNSHEVQEIRRLIKDVKDKIKLYEKNGVYLMPIWINTDVEDTVFSR